MSLDRYARQQLISPDWDQDRLFDAKVFVIGSGPYAISTVMALSMLGIGNIRMFDNTVMGAYDPAEYFYYEAQKGTPKVMELERILKLSNPLYEGNKYNPMGVPWKILNREHYGVLGDRTANAELLPDVVVDTTNDPFQEQLIARWCVENRIPFVNGSCMPFRAELKVLLPDHGTERVSKGVLSKEYEGIPQDPIMAGILGGLTAEEVRHIVMPLVGESLHDLSLFIDFLRPDNQFFSRVPFPQDMQNIAIPTLIKYPDLRVLQVGAGSLGTNTARGLVQRRVGTLVVRDDDDVENVNLNRQYEYAMHPSIGMMKVRALEYMLNRYSKETRFVGEEKRFAADYAGTKPDLLLRCTDSFDSSRILGDYAVRELVSLLYMASSAVSGAAYLSVPGKSPCIECCFQVSENAEQTKVPAGCIHAPLPSVGTVNMVVAYTGLALWDRFVIDPSFDPRVIVKYDSRSATRMGTMPAHYECTHNGV